MLLWDCNKCRRKIKRPRISSRKKEHQLLNEGEHSTRIQCKGCGRKIAIDDR